LFYFCEGNEGGKIRKEKGKKGREGGRKGETEEERNLKQCS
jgi:hypothetical protein